MKNLILLIAILLSSIISCKYSSSNNPESFMSFDEVVYVDNFPETFKLEGGSNFDIDVIGIRGFVILDTIMVLSTTGDNLWSIVSLPSSKTLGRFLKSGNGPSEFIELPSVTTSTQFVKEGSNLCAYIHDFQKGRLMRMDISSSLMQQKLNLTGVKDSLPPILFNFLRIDSTRLFCRQLINSVTQLNRFILDRDTIVTPPFLQKLNCAKIRSGEDINILSAIIALNNEKGIIVEAPVSLNYINMYSIDGKFDKTICIGKRLDRIDEIQRISRWNRKYVFGDLRLYDHFWGVLQINEDAKTLQTIRIKLPSLLLFNWEGKPLAEIKLNKHITEFDIDFNTGELYTFDDKTDEFSKYDIGEILTKLKINN